MEPQVLISIINCNDTPYTLKCLESLKSQKHKNYKIFVTENASKEDASIIKQKFPYIIFNQNKENLGFTGAHNQAFKYAIENNYKYILLLNPDTIVDENLLNELVKVLESDSKAGIVGVNIYDYDSNKILSSGGYISFITGIGYESKRPKNNQIQELINLHEYLDGCCILIKTDILKKIGFYDENYFIYIETADLCLRAKKAGFKIMHNPNAKVWHKIHGSHEGKKSPFSAYYLTRNRHIFIKKSFPKRYPLFLLTTIPVFLIQSILHIKRKRLDLILPTLKANIKGFKQFGLTSSNKNKS